MLGYMYKINVCNIARISFTRFRHVSTISSNYFSNKYILATTFYLYKHILSCLGLSRPTSLKACTTFRPIKVTNQHFVTNFSVLQFMHNAINKLGCTKQLQPQWKN